MPKTAGRILKASDVKLEGKLTLDIVQTGPSQTRQPGTDLVEPQVHVVESQPDFTVIEVTCSCGTHPFRSRCRLLFSPNLNLLKSSRTFP